MTLRIVALRGTFLIGKALQFFGQFQRFGTGILGPHHGTQTKFTGFAGTDILFKAGLFARNEQTRPVMTDDLAKRVVATHRNDTGSIGNKRFRFAVEVENDRAGNLFRLFPRAVSPRPGP